MERIEVASNSCLTRGSEPMQVIRRYVLRGTPFLFVITTLEKEEEDTTARLLAKTLWVEEDHHRGIQVLRSISPRSLHRRTMLMYLRRTVNSCWEETGDEEMRRLSHWIEDFTMDGSKVDSELGVFPSTARARLRAFRDMCVQRGFYQLAVYLSAVMGDWATISDVVRLGVGDKERKGHYTTNLLVFMRRNAPWELVDLVKFHFAGRHKMNSIHIRLDRISRYALCLLGENFDWDGLQQWAAFFYLHACSFSAIDSLDRLDSLEGDDADIVVMAAVRHGHWPLVDRLLKRCTSDNLVLLHILRWAVERGNVGTVNHLLPRVDLTQMHRLGLNCPVSSLFSATIRQDEHAEEMTGLLVKLGMSTHWEGRPPGREMLEKCLEGERVSLARMLYTSGIASDADCRQVINNGSNGNQALRKPMKDFTEFVKSHPVRSLQDACRLKVSHLLGYQPGREQRVRELKVAFPVEDQLHFRDVKYETHTSHTHPHV